MKAVDFIHQCSFDAAPAATQHAARRSLLDTLGVALAGTQTPTATIIADHAARHFGPGQGLQGVRLWQDGRMTSAVGAALAHGMMIDAVDAHDGAKLTKGHVGCSVVPTILAMAEATNNWDADTAMDALLMGYEIGVRAGISLHASVSDYHTSGAWGALTCAAIAARYLELDPETTRHALGIAEYHGPRSQMMRVIDTPTMLKDGSGWGAMAGVSAAYLAQDGFTGAPAISIEGDDVAPFWNDLGDRWHMNDQYIKLYPVCRWAQPPVEALLALQREHGFVSDDVETLHVTTFHEARRLATIHPADSSKAQYSLPFAVAAALVHGTIQPSHVADNALDDPAVLAMQTRVTMGEREAFNAAFPERRFAEVEVTLTDGTVLGSAPTEALGDPENPVSDDVLFGKFDAYAGAVIADAQGVRRSIMAMPHDDGLADILSAMQKRKARHLRQYSKSG